MALDVGTIAEGVVSGITSFGAFVNLPGNQVGLVHISEVDESFVRDVNDHLKVQDKVTVKVINIDPRGKIGLSIKQAKAQAAAATDADAAAAKPDTADSRAVERTQTASPARQFGARPPGRSAGNAGFAPPRSGGFGAQRSTLPESFEDKLSKFIKESDQKQSEFRRSTDAKRGGRGTGRS